MSLSIPSYIRDTGIADDPIEYDWDEYEDEFLCGDTKLESKIGAIAYRGVVAFSLGSAEWIVWRLSKHIRDPIPFQLIEAIWAGVIDWRYLKRHNIPEWEELQDTLGGSLAHTIYTLDEIVSLVSDREFASPESACLSELALHVMSDPRPFKEWRRFTIQRLTQMHPFLEDDVLGVPVPREALDPSFDYKPEIANKLLSNFLRNLDYTQNPYLQTPDEMAVNGFKGTPYLL